jgi:putative sterol carrier protein
MWKYADRKCYGMCEYVHADELHIPSDYYANDECFEVSGSRGMAVVRRCTGNIDEGPPLSLFTSAGWQHFPDIPSDWLAGFEGATRNFVDAIQNKAEPSLNAYGAYDILRFALAVQKSARLKREVYVAEMDASFPAMTRLRKRFAERNSQEVHAGLFDKVFGGTGRYSIQAADLTRALLGSFDPAKAAGWSTVIGLQLLADGAANEMKFGLHVNQGQASLTEGEIPPDAVLTITLPAGTWAAILLKKKRLETAFLQGKLKIEGRAEEGLKLRSVFGL